MTLEKELTWQEKFLQWKKKRDRSPEELRSIINQIENPTTKLVAKIILLEKE